MPPYIFQTVALVLGLVAWRCYSIFPSKGPLKAKTKRKPNDTCSLSVFLGSGGHTSEALSMLSGIDFQRYQPRQYFVSEGDSLSVRKVRLLEESKAGVVTDSGVPQPYRIDIIPRARRVHQSLLTTPLTALVSLAWCIYYITIDPLGKGKFADVLILNGPGTCYMLCAAVYVNKFLGLPAPTLIYIESFTRVKALSLTGKLVQPIADRSVQFHRVDTD